jgi:sugar transferase (PEP-CTERM/EpsH1 system associated)
LCVPNGVDSDYFSPERAYANPYEAGGPTLVFVGAMDYWPNVDAVTHFARSILPVVRARFATLRFVIVGSNPAPEVEALARDPGIIVTGRVPDVRPYMAHAAAIVAPLRVARGVQNKVLEGMAMAKPVIASPEALTGITAVIGAEILRAATPEEFVGAIDQAIMTEQGSVIGSQARRRVIADYEWAASLRQLDAAIDGATRKPVAPATILPGL